MNKLRQAWNRSHSSEINFIYLLSLYLITVARSGVSGFGMDNWFLFLPHSLVFIFNFSVKFQMLVHLCGVGLFYLWNSSPEQKQEASTTLIFLLQLMLSFLHLAECWDVIRHGLRRNTWEVYIQLCLREAHVFNSSMNTCSKARHECCFLVGKMRWYPRY